MVKFVLKLEQVFRKNQYHHQYILHYIYICLDQHIEHLNRIVGYKTNIRQLILDHQKEFQLNIHSHQFHSQMYQVLDNLSFLVEEMVFVVNFENFDSVEKKK